MMNNKNFATLEMVGETVVVLAAAMWISRLSWIPYIYCIAAIIMAVGRLGMVNDDKSDITLKRLFRQRNFGVFALLVSAALMFVQGSHYLGYNLYVFPSSWLIFFFIFVAIEVYTTIRILHLTKEK